MWYLNRLSLESGSERFRVAIDPDLCPSPRAAAFLASSINGKRGNAARLAQRDPACT